MALVVPPDLRACPRLARFLTRRSTRTIASTLLPLAKFGAIYTTKLAACQIRTSWVKSGAIEQVKPQGFTGRRPKLARQSTAKNWKALT